MRLLIRFFQVLNYFLLVVLLLLCALIWLQNGNVDTQLIPGVEGSRIKATLSGFDRDAGIWPYIAMTGFVLIFASVLLRIGQLMGLFLKGRYFTKKAVAHMRYIAGFYAFFSLISFAIGRWSDYSRNEDFGIWQFTGDDIFGLMLSLTFVIIVHVLNEARKNLDELDTYF